MATRLPISTHKPNGLPLIARGVVNFMINEFLKIVLPAPFRICDIETGPLFTRLYMLYDVLS